jgi:hypothetical protein
MIKAQSMSQQSISDALELEKNRFMKFIGEAATKTQNEVAALVNRLAAQGAAISSDRYMGEIRIHFSHVESVIEKQIALRQELGRKVPELFEEQRLKTLDDELARYVDSAVNGFINRRSSQPPHPGGAALDALSRQMEQQGFSIKAKLKAELEALRLESRLGLHKEPAPVVSFNISHSTIANLNLGTVVGDLQSSIQNLTGQGQPELAVTVQRLTEAIAVSQELQDAQRKELLEHLSLVATEAAHPPESRKMGPLKSSIAVLQTTLSTATQLAGLWSTAEHALKALGVLTA